MDAGVLWNIEFPCRAVEGFFLTGQLDPKRILPEEIIILTLQSLHARFLVLDVWKSVSWMERAMEMSLQENIKKEPYAVAGCSASR